MTEILNYFHDAEYILYQFYEFDRLYILVAPLKNCKYVFIILYAYIHTYIIMANIANTGGYK